MNVNENDAENRNSNEGWRGVLRVFWLIQKAWQSEIIVSSFLVLFMIRLIGNFSAEEYVLQLVPIRNYFTPTRPPECPMAFGESGVNPVLSYTLLITSKFMVYCQL